MSGMSNRRAVRRLGVLVFLVALAFAALPAASAMAAYPTYITSDYSASRVFRVTWWGPGQQGIPKNATLDVQYKDGASGAWKTWIYDTTNAGANFSGLYGHTYWFRTRWETAQTRSAWSGTMSLAVPYDNGSARFSSGWSSTFPRGLAFNSTVRYTSKAGASMSYTFTGKRVVLIATKGKGRGKLAVSVYKGRTRIAYRTVDTYYYATRYRAKVFDYTASTNGTYQIVVKNLGTRGRARVDVDAVAIVRPDITPPYNLSIGAPDYSKDQSPTITLDSLDNVSTAYALVASNPSMTSAKKVMDWSSTLKWDLGSAEGNKTIYARFYDEAGNWAAKSKQVVFDKTKPLVEASGDTTTPIGWPRAIDATVTDTSPLTVQIRYRPVAQSWFETATMAATGTITPPVRRYTYQIPGSATLTNVQYYVRVTDAAGNLTEMGPYAVGAKDITAPSIPTDVTTKPGDRSVSVTWTSSPETDTAGYRVWRSDAIDGEYIALGTRPDTTYVDSTALNGRTYYYAVSSIDLEGNESFRSISAAATLAQKLQSLSIELPATAIVGQSFTATVTATDDNNEPYTAGLTVALSEDGTGSLTPTSLAVPAGSGSASESFRYLANGAPAMGDVKITASVGSIATSATIAMQPVPAPTGLAAQAGDHQASLTWDALGYGVTNYRIYRATDTTPMALLATIDATSAPSYIDSSTANGDRYYYEVSGYSTDTHESLRSSAATAVLPQKLASIALQVPSSTIVGQPFTATVSATDDNGKPYTTGLTASMSEDGTGALTAPATVTIPGGSSTATGSLTYSATGSPATGSLKITATTSGAAPTSASINVLPVPAPNGLTAAAGDHKATLTWNALGYGVTNYRVYRSTATTAWTQIASVSATSAPTYVDTSTPNGDTYYYQVSGYSTATDEGLRSTSASATLQQKLASISMQLPSSAIVGQSFTATVTATDDNSKPYTRGLTATVTANGVGQLTGGPVQITAGNSTGAATFSYNAIGTVNVTATAPGPITTTGSISITAIPAPTRLRGQRHQQPQGLAEVGPDRPTPDVTEYRIWRSTATTTWAVVGTPTGAGTSSFDDTSVLNGDTYYYQISTYGPNGQAGIRSATATAVVPQQLQSLSLQLPATAIVGQSFTATVTATDDNGKPYTRGFTTTLTAPGPGTLTTAPKPIVVGSGSSTGTAISVLRRDRCCPGDGDERFGHRHGEHHNPANASANRAHGRHDRCAQGPTHVDEVAVRRRHRIPPLSFVGYDAHVRVTRQRDLVGDHELRRHLCPGWRDLLLPGCRLRSGYQRERAFDRGSGRRTATTRLAVAPAAGVRDRGTVVHRDGHGHRRQRQRVQGSADGGADRGRRGRSLAHGLRHPREHQHDERRTDVQGDRLGGRGHREDHRDGAGLHHDVGDDDVRTAARTDRSHRYGWRPQGCADVERRRVRHHSLPHLPFVDQHAGVCARHQYCGDVEPELRRLLRAERRHVHLSGGGLQCRRRRGRPGHERAGHAAAEVGVDRRVDG